MENNFLLYIYKFNKNDLAHKLYEYSIHYNTIIDINMKNNDGTSVLLEAIK